MEKFEEILLRVSRVFGAIVLTLTLVGILVITVSLVKEWAVKITEQTVPDVKFYKSDFVKEPDVLPGAVARPEPRPQIYAKKVSGAIKASFEKNLDTYISKNDDKLFDPGDKKEERKADYKKSKMEGFIANTEKTVSYILGESYKENIYDLYVSGLLDYFKKAETAGLDIYSADGYPVSGIYYSAVFQRYNDEFNKQYRSLQDKGENKGGYEALISKASTAAAVFFLIMIFLFVSVMFAIIRIEKKMKS